MSIETRNQIAYWFFLSIGIAGTSLFTYEFYSSDKYTFVEWVSIMAAFSVFIFRPMILVDLFNTIKTRIGGSGKDAV